MSCVRGTCAESLDFSGQLVSKKYVLLLALVPLYVERTTRRVLHPWHGGERDLHLQHRSRGENQLQLHHQGEASVCNFRLLATNQTAEQSARVCACFVWLRRCRVLPSYPRPWQRIVLQY